MTLNPSWREDGWQGPLDLTIRPHPGIADQVDRKGNITRPGQPACVEILGGLGDTVKANPTHLRDLARRLLQSADALERYLRHDGAPLDAPDGNQPSLFEGATT